MFASLHTSTMAIAHVQSRGSFADRIKDLVARIHLGLVARAQRHQFVGEPGHAAPPIGKP